jgi:tRNA splicing ligase
MSSASLPSATSMQEAASRPLEYNPTTRAIYIRSMVQEITRRVAAGETEESIRTSVPDFIEQYPELFKKLIKKEDLTPIHDMLRLLDNMGKGKLSQHQASVVVGKSLVDRYVTPQLKGANK